MRIVATPSGEALHKHLDQETEVVPLRWNSALPREDRPYYIHRADRVEIHALRTQSRQLVELIGLGRVVGAAVGSTWLFTDPFRESFDEEMAFCSPCLGIW